MSPAKGVLLGHSSPRTDELLSSWLVRLAAQNRMKLHSFSSMLCPRVPVWNRDIDNSAPPFLLNALAERTGVNVERVFETTLKSYESRIFEKHNPNGTTLWVLPLGIYHRTRLRFGVQCCPDCLDQSVTYYRKPWRLAWTVMCTEHNRPLIDRCDCGTPIVFHRGELGDRTAGDARIGLTKCHRCNGDLRRLSGSAYDIPLACAALEVQRLCLSALRDGYLASRDACIEGVLFFAGLRQLLQILAHGRHAERLRENIASWRHAEGSNTFSSGRHFTVERLAIEERMKLMALVGEWLFDWPAAFVKSCKQSGLTATDICRNLRYVPYWLSRVVDEYFGSGSYSPAIDEIGNAIRYLRSNERPVNKASVSRLLGRGDVFRKRQLSFLLRENDNDKSGNSRS